MLNWWAPQSVRPGNVRPLANRKSSQLTLEDVGDCMGDAPPVFFSRPVFLLDLDAVRAASGEPVDDVPFVVAAEVLVRLRYVHCEIRADHMLDGALELLLQGGGRASADQNVIRNFGVSEPMEGDGVSKAPMGQKRTFPFIQ
jgi:hypothetical protein